MAKIKVPEKVKKIKVKTAQKDEIPSLKSIKKIERTKKYMGSDCKHCSLQEGVYSMVYFCKLKSTKIHRAVCDDGFTGKCPDYKKKKIK
ncbi:hypothetical protein ACFL4O_03240 [bacterium]